MNSLRACASRARVLAHRVRSPARMRRYLQSSFGESRYSLPPSSLLHGMPPTDAPTLVQVANLYNSNAGDVLLPVVLRDLFTSEIGPIRWRARHAHLHTGSRAIAR